MIRKKQESLLRKFPSTYPAVDEKQYRDKMEQRLFLAWLQATI